MNPASEAPRIVDELQRSLDGDPWHGEAAASILRGVNAQAAIAKPRDGVHSIGEIVRHMTAWTNEVARRLDGQHGPEPEEGDWPPPAGATDDAWRQDVTRLMDAHWRLIAKVSALSDDAFHAVPTKPRDRTAGSGVSLHVLLHGLAQHHAYHAGQIAPLKKLA